MAQLGNKDNSFLNGDWGTHTKEKKRTSKKRRIRDKNIIKEELSSERSKRSSKRQ